MTDPDKIKPYGLSQVYCSDAPLVDIVFVHGLGGHPGHTWTSKSGVFWPADLLPQVLTHVRILTYGYNAEVAAFKDGSSRDHIHHHAETLASGLAANRNLRRCRERPLIFVCHSLGGLVVKRTLIYCRSLASEKVEHLRSVFVSTYGILFLGTPHNGSDIAKWGTLLQSICSAVLPKRIMETSSQLITSLRTNNETLQNINVLFADMLPRFHIYFFHETRSTDVKGTRQVIVDESSASPPVEGVERMGIEADHISMCKFEDESAPGYEVVAEALQRYSEESLTLIRERWAEEATARDLARRAKAREIYNDRARTIDEESAAIGAGSEHRVDSTPDPSQLDHASAAIPQPRPSIAQPLPFPVPNYICMPAADVGSPPVPEPLNIPELGEPSVPPEPFFLVPPGFHPNANFVGMERDLDQMHNRLYKAKKRPDRLTALLVHGVPGSGKTHLVRQYMWAQRDSYPGGIFWVDAKSRESTYKGYLDIAQAASLTLPEGQQSEDRDSRMPQRFAEEVRNWFQSREEWLLIFDGINFDYDEDLNVFKQILPFRKRSSIIYTSINKTLARKQRLYEPYCLSVSALREDDARELLFRDIGLKNPTRRQIEKANSLVKHYECLPLAVHAISHNLTATGKPIETYRISERLTDMKLAEPYLGIVHELYRMERFSAINLLNLLAFLGHQVPVGMVYLGKAALDTWDVQVMTSDRPGDRPNIDTTMGILIRCGLLERTSFIQQQSFTSSSDVDETTDPNTPPPETSESFTEDKDSFVESVQTPNAVDVIRIHSVIQEFCRDELKSMDQESGASGSERGSAGYHDSWLIVAAGVFCTAYERAKAKMTGINDGGSIKDYREFETHGTRLLQHFPKKRKKISKAPETVRRAYGDLNQAMGSIRGTLRQLSRSSSMDLPPKLKSVFDRSSSSSSSQPDSSSADDYYSREPTLDLADLKSPQVESPQEIPSGVQLNHLPPRLYRDPTGTGYETDGEDGGGGGSQGIRKQRPGKLAQMAQEARRLSVDSSDWQKVNDSTPRTSEERLHIRSNNFPPRVRSPQPAAPILRVFQVHGQNISNKSPVKGRRESQASAASDVLAAVHSASPPSPRNSNGATAVGSPPGNKENMAPYSAVAKSARANEIPELAKPRPASALSRRPATAGMLADSSVESLPSRDSHIAQSGLFSPENRSDRMSQSMSSETGPEMLTRKLNTLEMKAGNENHHAGHYNPTTLKLHAPAGDMSGSASSVFAYGSQHKPIDDNADIRRSRRMSATSRTGNMSLSAHLQHPSAFMPGSSPPSAVDMPNAYASDPIMTDQPMSRGPSGNSRHSWSTDPLLYPATAAPHVANVTHIGPNPAMSPMPVTPTSVAPVAGPPPPPFSGAGSWVAEMPPTQPAGSGTLHPESAYTAHAAHAAHISHGAHPTPVMQLQPEYVEPHQAAHGLYFGHQAVDLPDARHRLFEHSPFRVTSPPSGPAMAYPMYHANYSTPMFSHSHELVPPPPSSSRGVPARRGRSGSAPGYEGFGK